MSTEAPPPAAQVLRVALVAPLGYGVAVATGTPLPFLTGVLLAALTLRLPAPPPLRAAVLLAALAALLPLAFAGVAGALNEFPHLLLGFVWLVLFHAFRLQAAPRTATLGLLLQAFVIVVPLLVRRSEAALAAPSGAFAVNGLLAIGGVYLAFALFPDPGRAAGAPELSEAPGDAAARSRDAALGALVMLPPYALLLALDAATAMRVLFAMALVLVSMGRRDVRETGLEYLLSAVMAGAAALAFAALARLWPAPAAALLIAALLGLLVAPRAFAGRHRGAVALAIPLAWVLLATASGDTTAKTLEWCLYTVAGVLYAVWARALLARLPGRRPAAA